MLSPLASKPSTLTVAGGGILPANTSSKSSGGSGTPAPSGPFDEALASAMQDSPGAKPPAKDSIGPDQLRPQKDAGAAGEISALQGQKTSSLMDALNATTVPSAPMNTKAVLDAQPPVAVNKKPLVSVSVPATVLKTAVTVNPDHPAKEKETKPSQAAAPQDNNDVVSAAYAAVVPNIPAEMPAPVQVPSGNDNSGSGVASVQSDAQVPMIAAVVPLPAAKDAEPIVSATTSNSKETEAFSLKITPKAQTAPASAGNTTVTASANKGTEKADRSEQAVPAVKPVGSSLSALNDGAQKDATEDPRTVKKAGNSSATNSSSAAPSSLGQFSGVDREEKAREKEGPTSPVNGPNEVSGGKQEVAGFGPDFQAPAKEVKTPPPSAADARPVTAQTLVQDNAPATTTKEVAIRLQNPAGETINVKLVDQGGQVQVTVRSSDPAAASALRQDLSSLASNLDKAGWKPDMGAIADGSFEPVNQTRQMDRNNQDPQGSRPPEWQQQDTPKKRQSVSDMWDELLTNQTA